MQSVTGAPRRRASLLRVIVVQLVLLVVTVAAIEGILRILDLRYLRVVSWGGLHYQHDAELGWAPSPNVAFDDSDPRISRTIRISHNSLGLRDIEHQRGAKPTILVMGDSLVHGTFVLAEERFTDRLRERLPDFSVVNAGVAGYGTDQEFLFLRRLWKDVQPSVVVLTFCTENDRTDNSTNVRYDTYKPYLLVQPDGSAQFAGLPVPKSRQLYFRESWIAQHSALVRLAISAYVEASSRRIRVPDNTERIFGMMRDFVEGQGAQLTVALQRHDMQLEAYLQQQGIRFVSLDDAPDFSAMPKYGVKDFHWSPEGHAVVAERLIKLFSEAGILSHTAASQTVK